MDYDDSIPQSCNYIVDKRDEVLLQHGGVCTRVSFSKVVETDVPTFLRLEARKLGAEDRRMHIIRSMEHDRLAVIYRDQVFSYDVTGIADVPVRDMASMLRSDEDESFMPNIPFPLIYYGRHDGYVTATVALKPQAITYSSDLIEQGFSTRITLPPLWFRLRATSTFVAMDGGVAVVLDACRNSADTVLYSLPLPNVFNNGSICMGSVRLSGDSATVPATTMGAALGNFMDLFFGSNWNADLVTDTSGIVAGHEDDYLDEGRRKFYRELSARWSRSSRSSSRSVDSILSVLHVLEIPDGWRRLKYRQLGLSAVEFMGKVEK